MKAFDLLSHRYYDIIFDKEYGNINEINIIKNNYCFSQTHFKTDLSCTLQMNNSLWRVYMLMEFYKDGEHLKNLVFYLSSDVYCIISLTTVTVIDLTYFDAANIYQLQQDVNAIVMPT